MAVPGRVPPAAGVQNFPAFLELGRSKGIAVVIGAQDIAQVKAVYGDNQAKSWFGMIGTKIITRVNAGATAEELSRIIGDQEVERIARTTSRANGRSSVTESVQQEIRRVVTPSELATRLGPNKSKGAVRVLFLGLGADVYELDLPFIVLPARREPILAADWTHARPGGALRPQSRDEETPPSNDDSGKTPRPFSRSGMARFVEKWK